MAGWHEGRWLRGDRREELTVAPPKVTSKSSRRYSIILRGQVEKIMARENSGRTQRAPAKRS